MALVKYDPFRGFESLSRRMNSFLNNFGNETSVNTFSFRPSVDISEDAKGIYIHAELPGLKKEDVTISVNDDNILTIKGSKNKEERSEDKKEGYTFIRTERGFGEFQRSFLLPDNINPDTIKANYKDGLLDLTIEKTELVKPKEIEIGIE